MGGPDQHDAPKPSAQSHEVAVGARGDPAGVDVAGMRDECPAWHQVAELPPVDGAGGVRGAARASAGARLVAERAAPSGGGASGPACAASSSSRATMARSAPACAG